MLATSTSLNSLAASSQASQLGGGELLCLLSCLIAQGLFYSTPTNGLLRFNCRFYPHRLLGTGRPPFLSTHDPSQLMQFHQQFAQPTTMALKMGLHHCTPENREVKVRHCATILSLPCAVQQPKPICKHLIYVHTLLTITTKSNLSVLIMSCGQITKKANTRIDTMIILLKVPCR